MDTIIKYFLKDPLKILYLLGGAGGIHFWISKWTDRIRIKIRNVNSDSFITEGMEEHSYFKCEIENIGGRVTSLEPTVKLTAYSVKGKLKKYEGKITELDRDLPPHKAKYLTVDFPVKYEEYVFLVFRTYNFRLTRGFSNSLNVWSASDRIIGRLRFYCNLILFLLFKKYNEPKT
ncbi:hypothetical protein [Desulfoluna spongiiphila]|uniref:hypothetical protein n=1 Tax=Desulfoluna spongiiphila TaxID=419481 RepID=UPI001259A83C|nr:hypothetical protein [Desulfoluna spongiiphila]VVS91962.1 hypothetical protein DBB_15300 [Desulfoluna spongiiphila]